MHYIIATHHDMASGFLDAINILKGKQENISILNAYVESDDFAQEYRECLSRIGKDEKIIVLTDLVGGSVNQTVMRENTDAEIEIIAGINLDLVLSILTIDETGDVQQQIRDAVERSKGQMIYVNQLVKELIERGKNDN